MTLHVTNGDSTAGTLRRTSLGGDVVAWRDALHDGPVPPGDDEAVRATRARFLAEANGLNEATVLADLEERDRGVLAALEAGRDVVLSFEHDLYDQLQLVQALALVGRSGRSTERLRLICVGGFEGRPRSPASVSSTPSSSSRCGRGASVCRRTLVCAALVWDAFRQPDPRGLETLVADALPGLPFLAAALVRLLEELPAVGDGLARSERQALEALASGRSTPGELLLAAEEAEEAPFLGDTWLFRRVDALAGGERPLVDDTRRLTEDGLAVLAGRLDRAELVGVDRWLGGTHVQGPRSWRWDRASRRVVEPG